MHCGRLSGVAAANSHIGSNAALLVEYLHGISFFDEDGSLAAAYGAESLS